MAIALKDYNLYELGTTVNNLLDEDAQSENTRDCYWNNYLGLEDTFKLALLACGFDAGKVRECLKNNNVRFRPPREPVPQATSRKERSLFRNGNGGWSGNYTLL